MERYRKLETVQAVQYLGDPIPDVTCEGTREQRAVNGCDNTRGHLPHVHTLAIGGLTVLKKGNWIEPVAGGPFQVWSNARFRAYHEVPESESALMPIDPVCGNALELPADLDDGAGQALIPAAPDSVTGS